MKVALAVCMLWLTATTAYGNSTSLTWDPGQCSDPVACTPTTGYRMYRQVSCTGTFVRLAPDIVAPTVVYRDSDVWPGMTYCYYVVATDSTGRESSASNTLRFQVPAEALVVPVNLRRVP